MPFDRPTITELRDRIFADFESHLPGTDPRLRRSREGAFAKALTGASHEMYGALDWYYRQAMVDTAETAELERHAAIWNITRLAASTAAGSVDVTGTDGTDLPAGTELQTGDGVSYTTDSLVTIAGGTATVEVTAVEAGAAGNQLAGVTLSFISPVVGIDSQGTVAAGGIGGGADVESDESLRERVLDRLQQPPQGGSESDYIQWARSVAGVTRVFIEPGGLGAGTVVVRFMMDDAYSDGVPQQADVDAVAAVIDPLRPVTASVTVYAPVPQPVDLEIQLTPDTTTVRTAVTAELQDLLRRIAAPGATIPISKIREAISIAAGEEDHNLVTPVADVTTLAGEIAVLGTITWS